MKRFDNVPGQPRKHLHVDQTSYYQPYQTRIVQFQSRETPKLVVKVKEKLMPAGPHRFLHDHSESSAGFLVALNPGPFSRRGIQAEGADARSPRGIRSNRSVSPSVNCLGRSLHHKTLKRSDQAPIEVSAINQMRNAGVRLTICDRKIRPEDSNPILATILRRCLCPPSINLPSTTPQSIPGDRNWEGRPTGGLNCFAGDAESARNHVALLILRRLSLYFAVALA